MMRWSAIPRFQWSWRVMILLFTMLLMGSGYATAQETPTPTPDVVTNAPRGTVTGKVTNGTAASSAPSNVSVTLLINHEDATVVHMDTKTAADGSFQFNDVRSEARR